MRDWSSYCLIISFFIRLFFISYFFKIKILHGDFHRFMSSDLESWAGPPQLLYAGQHAHEEHRKPGPGTGENPPEQRLFSYLYEAEYLIQTT